MSNLDKYVAGYKQIDVIRAKHDGGESQEEDTLMERLDALWYKLTDEEAARVNGLCENTGV